MPGEKRKKSAGNKKRDSTTNIQKRIARKKKNDEPASLKTTPPPANMIPEQPALPFHNPGTSKYRRIVIIKFYLKRLIDQRFISLLEKKKKINYLWNLSSSGELRFSL